MGRGQCADRYDAANGNDDEVPEHTAIVASYYLDTFEVTVGRFRRFVEAYDGTPPAPGAGAHPLIPGSGWDPAWNADLPASQAKLLWRLDLCVNSPGAPSCTWSDAPAGREDYPMNWVPDWTVAFAFCIWDGGRVPTEAEWEYAAAGGEENRLFPWGADPVTKDLAVFFGSNTGPLPVGSAPAGHGRWGHFNLAGNVSEAVRDAWGPHSYGCATCDNCANLPKHGRGARGGTFASEEIGLRCANRDGVYVSSTGFGIRCARSL
jgi:formylglycine-generating enzyme required for sulfatase activity